MTLDSSTATSDQDRSTLFNTYFCSVFTHSSYLLPPVEDIPVPDSSLSSFLVSEDDVYRVLSSLDTTKAVGLDGIGPKVLRFCAPALSTVLHHLFNCSLSQHSIPAEWRIHCITPIYKSGDRSSVRNYRPISLLSCTSKVLERLVFDRCIEFLESALSSAQFGFLRNRSTLQQLLLFYKDISESVQAHSQSDVIFLDFAKAFDSVPHNELLLKLRKMGVCGDIWYWFSSYLTGRQQCVRLGNTRSGLLPVLSGVPQGSILGPLLFLVYINDLPSCAINSHLLLFADDAKCAKPIKSMSDSLCLQADLDSLCEWSHQWKLSFKEEKCALLSFCRRHRPVSSSYTICHQPIVLKSSHSDLGVVASADLSWSAHYDHLASQAYKLIGLLRRTLQSTDSISAKKQLYTSLVRPRLLYCSQLWRPHLIKGILRLEKIQRRVTKFILNDYVSDYRSRLSQLNLLPLMSEFELNDMMFCIKCLKFPARHFDINQFITFSANSTRSGTHGRMTHSHSSSNISRHSYFLCLPRLWNSFPPVDINQSLRVVL